MKIDFSFVKQILERCDKPGIPDDPSYQSTSVFLLLFDHTDTYILAILKSDNEGYPWANQVALPGGHIDKEDASPVDAAFRELEEELKINRHQIEFIGSMGHFQTINKRDIEVFIGWWQNRKPVRYDSTEIAKVLEIPIKALIQTHRERNYQGRMPSVNELLYPYGEVVIWGVTARILHHFIEMIHPYIIGNSE